jgi:hypothetical protein
MGDRSGPPTVRGPARAAAGLAARALAAAAILLAAAPSLRAQPVPLVVEDRRPEADRARGASLAAGHPWVPEVMELVGLEGPGEPIHVLLLPESSPMAREVPSWVAGFANGTDTVVLLPERTPGYPDGGLEEVLAHEVAHVLIDRAAGGRKVPRWFHEGVAMVAGRSWGLRDRTQVALDLLFGSKVPLNELDALFWKDERSVRRAYALSGALVQELLERWGPGLPRALLARMGRGERFDEAMRSVTGAAPWDVAAIFQERQAFWRRWLPILTSGAVLWFLITVMAVAAALERRRRQREQLARMEAEERAAEAAEAVKARLREREEAAARAGDDEGGPGGWTVN